MLKMALIEVRNPKRTKERCFPPLGLAYIAAYLKKHYSSVDVKIFTDDIINNVERFQPDLVGISSVTKNFGIAERYAKEIKQRFGLPIIVGGVHISMLPHTLPKSFDVAVLGEGEQSMVELLDLFKTNGFQKEKLSAIDGIAFQEQDKVVVNKFREPIKNMDLLPFPARDLFEIKGEAHMVTSRGCPYRCAFCSSSNFWKKIRFFSAEYVVKEIEEIINKFKIDSIYIYDDLFIANKERLKKIVDLIDLNRINRKVEFSCLASANLISDETCALLKKMGVRSIAFGFESGSPRILSFLKKNLTTIEMNRKAVEICNKNGFDIRGSFIVGSPSETLQDIEMTLAFIKEIYINGGDVYPLTPFPGTEAWQYALKKGLVSEKMDWSMLDVDNLDPQKIILLTEEINKNDFWRYRSKIQNELSSKWKKNILKSIFTWPKFKKYLYNPKKIFDKIIELFEARHE